jgi:hypothetical protein
MEAPWAVTVTGWHRHRRRPGLTLPANTTNKGWGLLSGHQRGLRPGHQRGLFHGHGQVWCLRWCSGRRDCPGGCAALVYSSVHAGRTRGGSRPNAFRAGLCLHGGPAGGAETRVVLRSSLRTPTQAEPGAEAGLTLPGRIVPAWASGWLPEGQIPVGLRPRGSGRWSRARDVLRWSIRPCMQAEPRPGAEGRFPGRGACVGVQAHRGGHVRPRGLGGADEVVCAEWRPEEGRARGWVGQGEEVQAGDAVAEEHQPGHLGTDTERL